MGYLKKIGKTLTAGLIAIILLSMFCLVYSYLGIHYTSTDGATDYNWLPHQYKANMTEGFAWFRMDGNGFNNEAMMSRGEMDVLLMGASHLEGTCLPQENNMSFLLNHQYHINCYNIGISGHDLATCVNNLESALDTYAPKQVVVLGTNMLDVGVDRMQAVLEDCYEPIPSYDSGIVYYAQKIPAIKTIYKQLTDWNNKTVTDDLDMGQKNFVDSDKNHDEYAKVLNQFLAFAENKAKAQGVRLLILYYPQYSVGDNDTLLFEQDDQELAIFQSVCDQYDIIFVNMMDIFTEMYQSKQKAAFGFYNTTLGSGHLNSDGHAVCARKLAEAVEELEE